MLEPDELISALAERWLTEAGYAVVIGEPDIAARGRPPALVIAELADPVADKGFVRTLEAVYAAPVLAVSTRFRRGLASTDVARRLGVRQVLPKPYTRDELLGAVRDSLENRPAAGELP